MLATQRSISSDDHRKPNRSARRLCLSLSFACALAAFLCGGCRHGDSGPDRVIVSGAVVYQGTPVAEGIIHFTPTKGSTGPVTIVKIADGKYRADAKGGVPVGTQKVEISASRPNPKYAGKPAPGPVRQWPPQEQYIPAKYNSRSELEIVLEPRQGDTTINFDLIK